MIALVKG